MESSVDPSKNELEFRRPRMKERRRGMNIFPRRHQLKRLHRFLKLRRIP